jgi:hypothetical protein
MFIARLGLHSYLRGPRGLIGQRRGSLGAQRREAAAAVRQTLHVC